MDMPDGNLQEQRNLNNLNMEMIMHREAEEQGEQGAILRQQMQAPREIQQQGEGIPLLVQGMEAEAQIGQAAPELAHRENGLGRKKRAELERTRRAAAAQQVRVQQQENRLQEQRNGALQGAAMTDGQLAAEAALLAEQLKASRLRERVALLEAGELPETGKMEIRLNGEMERARLAGDYARRLPPGSVQRKKAMEAKEEQEIRAHSLKKKLSVARMENEVEREREEATIKRHEKYDMLKKIFRKDNPLSHEDATWRHPETGHQLVNVGRAFFGGTKPMYIFEDRDSPVVRDGRVAGYKQYLFKEAVNCIGFYKPEGALVTEAAARLQDRICGPYSIPAFAAVQNGRVLGSFQEKVDTIDAERRVDLFQWQTQPADNIPEAMKAEILREHALDWLLCNFDTKGENFLHRTDGHLCSFDKEASFGKLKDEGAQHMSKTYKPHANDTLYNTLFQQFAAGALTLDLSTVVEQINRINAISDVEYLGMFEDMLTQKYGEAVAGNSARQEIEEKILERKAGIREEYRAFFTGLLMERAAALGRNDYPELLNANSTFVFADEHASDS